MALARAPYVMRPAASAGNRARTRLQEFNIAGKHRSEREDVPPRLTQRNPFVECCLPVCTNASRCSYRGYNLGVAR
jgi:hypothetical protein